MREKHPFRRSSLSRKLVRVPLIATAVALLGPLLAGAEPSGLTAADLVSRTVPAAIAADSQRRRDVPEETRKAGWRWKGSSAAKEKLSPRPDLRAGSARNRIQTRPLD